jgi:hypothetical protein
MERVETVIRAAVQRFRTLLQAALDSGGFTRERYVRYLSMQHHLTKGVQRHFLIAASHPSMVHKPALRKFLIDFALEEETHYEMARRDVEALGQTLLPCPLDVTLWWTYFDSVIYQRPLLRLGATCILENLGPGASELARALLASARFLTPANTTFLRLHIHDQLPHGDDIVMALREASLDAEELADVEAGARAGATLYLRMAEWAMRPELEWLSDS